MAWERGKGQRRGGWASQGYGVPAEAYGANGGGQREGKRGGVRRGTGTTSGAPWALP